MATRKATKRAAKPAAKPAKAAKVAKRGRPARGGGGAMGQMLRVRFTDREWSALSAAAEKRGLTMSDVVRAALESAGVL